MEQKKLNRAYKGIILIILSALCFALMGVFVRLAGDLPSIQKSFFRNIVALFFSAAVLIKSKEKPELSKKSLKYLFLRAAFGTIGLICNFYALDKLVLADASILNKMSPFFAIIASYFVLKEKISPTKIIIVAVAFTGSLFVIKPSFQNAQLLPSVIGLLGGLGAGIAYTMVRKLGTMGIKGPFIVFFFSAFSSLTVLPFMIADFKPMSKIQILYLLLAGLCATGGQFTITSAYIYAPARNISIYDYSQIIFTSVLGFLIFGQIPDILSITGYILIVSMAVIMFLINKKSPKA